MSCTLIAGFDSAGHPLLGSNSDNPYSTRTRLVVDRAAETKFVGTRIESLTGSVAWDDMVTRAVNEHGLAFTWSSIPCKRVRDGIELIETGRRLATAQSIDNAIDTLRAGSDAVSGCFLVADANTGTVGVVEAAGGETAVERLTNGVTARANQFTSSELVPLTDDSENPYRHSAERRTERAESLTQDGQPIGTLTSILSDHSDIERGGEYGWSICNHGEIYGTVSSELLVPEDGAFYYLYGRPCGDAEGSLGESWSRYLAFDTSLELGTYTDSTGSLTARGVNAVTSGVVAPLSE